MRTFGLIGFPLTHSFSPAYFAEKFRREGIADAQYRLFPLEHIGQLPDLLQCENTLCGFNVTIPHKETILPLLDVCDELARRAGAINTVRIVRGETGQHGPFRLFGTNTDVYGFRQSLKPFLTSAHERALILGTGGAAKAVDLVLREIGLETLFVSSSGRNLPNRTVLPYTAINEYVMAACKLIVNTTPVGQFPETTAEPALPYHLLTPAHLLYDLIYNPTETVFMHHGKSKGCAVMNGLDMLKLQADKAWEYWNVPFG